MSIPVEQDTGPLEVLRAARAALDTHGWIKEAYVDRDGCMCLSGAVNYAAFDGNALGFFSAPPNLINNVRQASVLMATKWMCETVEQMTGHDYGIIWYNDNVATCVEDVLTVLDKTIEAHS